MEIMTNPIIKITAEDECAIRKTHDIIQELLWTMTVYTVTDDGEIVCADNAEILITEREAYSVVEIMSRLNRIMKEAPISEDAFVKELAISFEY